MTNLEDRLSEANFELVKLKDTNVTVHDHNALLTILATHQDMLIRKITLCNDRRRQLHSTIRRVISEEQNWRIEYLTMEFEHMETQYEGLYRSFKEYLREFEIKKLETGKLGTRYFAITRDRNSLRNH